MSKAASRRACARSSTAPAEPVFWIPLIFGLLLLSRLIPGVDYLSRWAIALIVAMTDLVVYLASDRASYVNGARIPVDGGYTINVRA